MTATAITRFAGMDLEMPVARAQVTPNSSFGWTVVRGQTPSDFQGTGEEVRLRGWERHAVVQACVRAIAEMIASIPIEATDRPPGEKDVKVLSRHPVLDVIRGVNGGLSELRLKALLATQFLNYGNGFGMIERMGRRRGQARRIRVIPPANVTYAWLDPDTDLIEEWDWRDLQGRSHSHTPASDMLHFKDLDARDGLFGYPRGAAALRSILSDSEASEYVRQVVTNHGTPGVAVMLEGTPTQEELDAGRDRWQERYVNRGQRGAAAFMAGVKDLKMIGFDLQQLEFPELRGVAREDICTAFNVDRRIIGVSSGTSDGGLSGEQFREARHRLIQMAAYPVMRVIEDELNHTLTPEFGDVWLRFSEEYIAAITEDVTQTSTRVLAEVSAKVRTVEEGRDAIGLPAEMPKDDTYPGGMTIGDTKANAVAMQQALLEATKTPIASEPPDDRPNIPSEQRAGRVLAITARIASGLGGDAAWRSQDELARREEDAYTIAALRQFSVEREQILREFAALAAEGAAVESRVVQESLRRIEAQYAVGGTYHKNWLHRYKALIARTVQVGGRSTLAHVGLSFNLQNPHAQAVIARRTAYLVQHVTETTRDAIRAAVATGQQQGLGVRGIAKLIEETTFGAITNHRALVIARTETIGALNAGAYEAAVASGVMRSKSWLAQPDDRVRETHAAIHGQRVPIDAVFNNGLPYPHADGAPASEVIGCRCTLQFHDQEAG